MNSKKSIFFLSIFISSTLLSMDNNLSIDAASCKLTDICKGPDPRTHIFTEAGYIRVSDENPFDAQLERSTGEMLSMSVCAFGKQCLEPAEEVTADKTPFKVRTVMESLSRSGRIGLICVHGTYSQNKALGDDLEKQSTHSIIDLANKMGVSYNKAVDVVSFVWSGILGIKERKDAGSQLADFLIAQQEKYDFVWTIAHSHGCNVVNWAGLEMLKTGHLKPIHTAIHLGSPTADFLVDTGALDGISNPEYVFNMHELYNFYGSDDCTQVVASLLSTWASGRKTRPGTEAECIAYNVRSQFNGYQCDHMNIKSVIGHLPGLIHAIQTYYTCFFDLDANMLEGENGQLEYPMVAIRKQSSDPHHPELRANYRRAREYSAHQELRYKKWYGESYSIHGKESMLWRVVAVPLKEWWYRGQHDKLKPASQPDQQDE